MTELSTPAARLEGAAVLTLDLRYSQCRDRSSWLARSGVPGLPAFPSSVLDPARDYVHDQPNVALLAVGERNAILLHPPLLPLAGVSTGTGGGSAK